MKISTIAASVLIALAAIVFVASATGVFAADATDAHAESVRAEGPLTVTPAQGAAPLSVTVTGPQRLMAMIAACTYRTGWITPGFSIEWGDGQSDPNYFARDKQGQSCADVKSHRYSVPGTYTVRAHIYHLGPTDAPETDWSGDTQITVTGAQTQAAPTLRIVNIREGQLFSYQALPTVEWEIATNRKVDVRTDLATADGQVIASTVTKGVAYDGQGQAMLPQTSDAYDAALKRNTGPYLLSITAIDHGRDVSEAHIHVQIISELAVSSRSWAIAPESGKAPLTVTLTYSYFHRQCFSYRVDWGDQSKPDEKIQPIRAAGCALDGDVLRLNHKYDRSGHYRVVIKTNNLSPFKSLNDIVYYEASTVVVTP